MIDNITKRLDRVQKIPERFLSETPPVPISVKIELSGKCNYQCNYCSLVDRDIPGQNMDFDLFKDMTLEMKEIGVEEIGPFFIGESFTNPIILIAAIDYLKNVLKFDYVFLTSNASLANPEYVRMCMDNGLDSLKWSVNAANGRQFSEMMGVNDKLFYKALCNIKDAFQIRKDNNLQTKLYASSIEYDDKQREKMSPILNSAILPYVDQHYWLPLYSMAGFATEREGKMNLKPVPGNIGRCDDPVAPIPCWLLFTSGHVMADGRLTACGYDALGTFEVGDLKTQSFMEAWHSREFRELRKAHLSGNLADTKCEKCLLLG